jgi:transaldolase
MLRKLRVKLFADGADLKGMQELYANPLIQGMTTNPTLMRKAGIQDYETFAQQVLATVKTKPVSFEVFSDDFAEMHRQARKIASWQENVFVKIPITNTLGQSSVDLIRDLSKEGVCLNVTAILTVRQLAEVTAVLNREVPAVLSVFAGRIADTGVDPAPVMKECLTLVRQLPRAELLWASVREALNIYQADACGCDIVTVGHDILGKAIKMSGMDLEDLSLDTVKMFANDAASAGFTL